jgi:hypothetical protein
VVGVLYARRPELIAAIAPELTEIGSRSRVLLAGEGAEPEACEPLGAAPLREGPVAAAEAVAG